MRLNFVLYKVGCLLLVVMASCVGHQEKPNSNMTIIKANNIDGTGYFEIIESQMGKLCLKYFAKDDICLDSVNISAYKFLGYAQKGRYLALTYEVNSSGCTSVELTDIFLVDKKDIKHSATYLSAYKETCNTEQPKHRVINWNLIQAFDNKSEYLVFTKYTHNLIKGKVNDDLSSIDVSLDTLNSVLYNRELTIKEDYKDDKDKVIDLRGHHKVLSFNEDDRVVLLNNNTWYSLDTINHRCTYPTRY